MLCPDRPRSLVFRCLHEHVPTGTETWDMFNKDFLRILRLSYRWGEMQSFVKQTLAEVR